MAGRKKGNLSAVIGCHLSNADKAQIEHLSPEQLDAWVDARLATKQARQAEREKTRLTPKAQRPDCETRTRVGGPCRAKPVWDRERNQPRNGRCRLHGGLSTEAKTPEGKRRVLECLKLGPIARREQAAARRAKAKAEK